MKKILISISIVLCLLLVFFYGYNEYKAYKLNKDTALVCNIIIKDFNNNITPSNQDKEMIEQYRNKYFLTDSKFNIKNKDKIFSIVDASGKLLYYYENKDNKDKTFLEDFKNYSLEMCTKYSK